jgi:hypothetical protein
VSLDTGVFFWSYQRVGSKSKDVLDKTQKIEMCLTSIAWAFFSAEGVGGLSIERIKDVEITGGVVAFPC